MADAARRYARALMDVVGAGGAEKTFNDLVALGKWFEAVPGFKAALENPSVPQDVKDNFIDRLGAEASFSAEVVRFVKVVVVQRRLGEWTSILGAFQVLADESRGILRARMITAEGLSKRKEGEIRATLSRVFGKDVELESVISSDILGGIQLQVGSTIYDGSVAGALGALRATLVKG
ncbi:MAG: ATP synthase F1 subunit delta [Acidobacteriota bacterium]|jgi:F-type H+-transporting ATPase subunit delta